MMSQCNLATINSTHPHHDIVLVNFITRLRNRIKKKTNDIISDVYIIILLVARGESMETRRAYLQENNCSSK